MVLCLWLDSVVMFNNLVWVVYNFGCLGVFGFVECVV